MNLQKHDKAAKDLFLLRTFDISAGFVVPYLSTGISIIDCGCGPGNITIELAKRVAPGNVIGIDADESSLEIGRELAKKQCVNNISLKKAMFMNFRLKMIPSILSTAMLSYLI